MTRLVWIRPRGGEDVGRLAREGDLLHRRPLEQLRAALRRRPRRAPGRRDTDRASRRPCARSAARRAERDLARDRARVEQRRVDPGGAPRLLLALQARHLLRRHRDGDRRMRLDEAFHVEPAEQRREVERRAPPALERALRAANADRLLEIGEADPGIVVEPARRRPAAAVSDLRRFEQRHLDAGRGERVRRGAAGQPAADDDDVGGRRAAVARIRRARAISETAGSRENGRR